MLDINAFMHDQLIPRINSDPIDNLRWVRVATDVRSAQFETVGIVGRFVACVYAGFTRSPKMGGDNYIFNFEIWNMITGVWAPGGPVGIYAPNLIEDMQHIHGLVHGYLFYDTCYALSREGFGTVSFEPQLRQTTGQTHSAATGFSLEVGDI